MSGDILLGFEANPGAAGANLAVIYFNLSGALCIVGNDGVEHAIATKTGNDETVSGNLTVTGTLTQNGIATFTANVNPAVNGVPALGGSNLGFKELFLDYINTATIGAVTINKASGRVNIGVAATSVVVTNNLVTANSHVICTAATNDTTGRVNSVVAAAGNFTINCTAPAANMAINFVVFGAD